MLNSLSSTDWRLIGVLILSFLVVSSSQDCDPKCKTQNCDSDGFCICEVPDNSTMLQGDRQFFGGEFCDIERTMCDGSNSFWCQSGTCNEIIQGENYTCTCKEGYAGTHCELEGVPCGESYCFHNAECIQGDVLCDCPAEWKGSEDCSKPTVSTAAKDAPVVPVEREDDSGNKWYFPFSVALVVVVLSGIVFLVVRKIRRQSSAANEFHRLRQVQMRGFIDEDEDSFVNAPLSKAEIA